MKPGWASLSSLGLAFCIALSSPVTAETLHIGGTGAVMEPLRQIGTRFSAASGVAVEVIPGLGSAGSISAAAEGVLQMVVSGRQLSAAEAARGLTSVLTVCTPYVLITSHPSPGSLDHTAVAAIYRQTSPKWPDGTPIRVVLRPKAESDNIVMQSLFPGMEQGFAQARTRDAIPIGATDQDNADLAEQIAGSLTGSTYAQIVTEHRALRFVAIDGTLPGLEALESGRYPFPKQLYVVTSRHPGPDVVRFLDFLRSTEGNKPMRDVGIVRCPV